MSGSSGFARSRRFPRSNRGSSLHADAAMVSIGMSLETHSSVLNVVQVLLY